MTLANLINQVWPLLILVEVKWHYSEDGTEATLVATAGDRDRWERQYRIVSEMSLDELREYIDAQLKATDDWARLRGDDDDDDNAGATMRWSHRDRHGDAWVSSYSFQREPADDAYLLTMQIERSTATRNARH